jgi:nucleotide-binding universal stress UspA family protein
MVVRTQISRATPGSGAGSAGRPILLVTLGAPLDERAATFALDTAVESGAPLVVANITRLEMVPLSVSLGYDALEEFTPDVSASLRRLSELARSLGVAVERLRVRTPRQVQALLELIRDLVPGIVVFGPDRERVSRRLFRRSVHALRRDVTCLVWIPA